MPLAREARTCYIGQMRYDLVAFVVSLSLVACGGADPAPFPAPDPAPAPAVTVVVVVAPAPTADAGLPEAAPPPPVVDAGLPEAAPPPPVVDAGACATPNTCCGYCVGPPCTPNGIRPCGWSNYSNMTAAGPDAPPLTAICEYATFGSIAFGTWTATACRD